MTRSVLAVLAGIATLTIVSFAIEAAVNASLRYFFPIAFPNPAALDASIPVKVFMTIYTLLSIAVGGYVTARIAPRFPLRHAVIMGAIELLMTIGVMFELSGLLPVWGWIANMACIVPAAWWGAKLAENRQVSSHHHTNRSQ